MPGAKRLLLLDACVVIDFCDADRSVLTLAANSLGEVYVPSTVLAEVDDLDEAAAVELGIRVVEPPLELLAEAATPVPGLSFEDLTLLLLAEKQGWTCVTNDRPLRSACESKGVSVMWGFEVLLHLVEARALPPSAAREIAQQIARSNKRIGPSVLSAFLRRLAECDR
jgi:rRNA-processing protein FCF1